jgi:hypothetical protein
MAGPYVLSEHSLAAFRRLVERERGDSRTHRAPLSVRDNPARLPAVRLGLIVGNVAAAQFDGGGNLTSAGTGKARFGRLKADGSGVAQMETGTTPILNVLPRELADGMRCIFYRDQTLEDAASSQVAAAGYIAIPLESVTALVVFQLNVALSVGVSADALVCQYNEAADQWNATAEHVTVHDVGAILVGQWQADTGARGIALRRPGTDANHADILYLEEPSKFAAFEVTGSDYSGNPKRIDADLDQQWQGYEQSDDVSVFDTQELFQRLSDTFVDPAVFPKGYASWDDTNKRWQMIAANQMAILYEAQLNANLTGQSTATVKNLQRWTFYPYGAEAKFSNPETVLNPFEWHGNENDKCLIGWSDTSQDWVLVVVKRQGSTAVKKDIYAMTLFGSQEHADDESHTDIDFSGGADTNAPTSVLEHVTTPHDGIKVKQSGYYLVSYSVTADLLTSVSTPDLEDCSTSIKDIRFFTELRRDGPSGHTKIDFSDLGFGLVAVCFFVGRQTSALPPIVISLAADDVIYARAGQLEVHNSTSGVLLDVTLTVQRLWTDP